MEKSNAASMEPEKGAPSEVSRAAEFHKPSLTLLELVCCPEHETGAEIMKPSILQLDHQPPTPLLAMSSSAMAFAS